MKTCKNRCLFAWKECGCLSHAISLCEGTTAKDVGKFHATAFARKCRVQDVQPGDIVPSWECERHHAERMNRAKQSILPIFSVPQTSQKGDHSEHK